MINQIQIPPSAGNNANQVIPQKDKTGTIRMAVALAILGLYLGSLIIAGIHQLL